VPKYKYSSPFHLAIPVHNLEEAKKFYGGILGLKEGRSSEKWQDYDFYGN
jgi:extradiol dioxygenase family protein